MSVGGQHCDHKGQDTWDLVDAQGIYCAKVCRLCEASKRAQYTPQTFSDYGQADVDEPIEPEETLMPDECYEGDTYRSTFLDSTGGHW